MKIAIVEYLNIHLTYINSLINIFDFRKNNITMFVSEEVRKSMKIYLKNDYKKIKWIIYYENFDRGMSKKIKWIFCLMRVSYKINKCSYDKIIFCSPEYYAFYLLPLFFILKKQKEIIITIHNLIRAFSKSTNIWRMSFKYIISQSTSLAVLEEPLKKYVLENNLTAKKIYIFPFDFYRFSTERNIADKISFVVPGNICNKRKDYEILMNIFDIILNCYDIEIVILGYGKGEYAVKILEWAEEKRNQGKNVISYHKFVPIDEYENRLKNASIIINPIKVNIDGEIYGVTKSTGTVFEMIAFAKPAILPKEYKVPLELKNSVLQYENEKDLLEILDNFIRNTKERREIENNALCNSLKFTLKQIRMRVNK